ncbi:uncharacterized protein LOC5516684 isoform X2 [Nematostella vectensis]|uniref:uncharacterized protein LOC5516684 isoform X2 n=1 Tax=Nematostella vectensis TaxID=45351 RepID=UPI002077522C|nr:uncharacterized protein LOC5516684 isoform X2 [Nematostella vectensis]
MENSNSPYNETLPNKILTTTAGSLSIFGTLVIFLTFYIWKDLRTASRKILVYISIGDFLTALVNISGLWLSATLYNKVYSCQGAPFLTMGSIEAARKADRKFTFIPVIFILLRMWGTIRFFLYISGQGHPEYEWLRILHGIGDSSQGFANFVIFCVFTEKMGSHFKYWFSKIFPCCSKPMESSAHVGYESTNILTDHSYET